MSHSFDVIKYKPREKSYFEQAAYTYPNLTKVVSTPAILGLIYPAREFSRVVFDATPKFGKVVSNLSTLLTVGFSIRQYWHINEMAYRASQDRIKKAQKVESGDAKPVVSPFVVKTTKKAFNHIFDFEIANGKIWCCQRFGPERKWKQLFFEGDPLAISADGANLVVIDSKYQVYYRKILRDGRGYNDLNKLNFLRHVEENSAEYHRITNANDDTYAAIDKTEKNNWKKRWYNFYILCHPFNLISGDKLTLQSPNAVISQMGRFAKGYTDGIGQFHAKDSTTTLYELVNDGKNIRMHDPWTPELGDVQIAFPHKFKAVKIDASGSTIMALGYMQDSQTPVIKVRLCDFDTEGHNPYYTNAYAVESSKFDEKADIRFLHDLVEHEGWITHNLPNDIECLYEAMAIEQTGIGNLARTLSVAVKRTDGTYGYYRKKIDAPSWQFTEDNALRDSQLTKVTQPRRWTATIRDFGCTLSTKGKPSIQLDGTVENFGDHIFHSIVNLSYANHNYRLGLHKRLQLGTFVGLKHERYDLVIPAHVENADLLNLFGNQRVMKVQVTRNNDTVSII